MEEARSVGHAMAEVTSPSTESIDRREKVLLYRKIQSPRAYLLVDRERGWIERHWRGGTGEWRQGGLDTGPIPVPRPETSFPLEAAYEGP